MDDRDVRIMVVDDEFSVRDSLVAWFEKDGYRVTAAADALEALDQLEVQMFDVVLLDIRMPGMDGMELQDRIHTIDPDIAVIMITAFASVETAVQALKRGAFDYVTKPIDPDELSHLVARALERRRLKEENAQLRGKIDEISQGQEVIGQSPPMQKARELIERAVRSEATVLLRGESGTGKELVARAIHAGGHRRYFPIVPVRCGALSESLLESELYGHEKGAVPGAQYRRKGKLEMANGGTLFLDEIGTISSTAQIDLLRVMENKELTRLGGQRPVKVDFRVICATNENLEARVAEGSFREDLYYRINVVVIELPPLRHRREDIPLLSRHFLRRLSMQMDKQIDEISPAAMEMLVNYDWPGNVRELANAIERAMVVGQPPAIRPDDLPVFTEPSIGESESDALEDVEKVHIARVLDRTSWDMARAAQRLGIDRATLDTKIERYELRK